MLEYMLLISREASFKLWSYGMSVRSFISWTVFVTLYVNGPKHVAIKLKLVSCVDGCYMVN